MCLNSVFATQPSGVWLKNWSVDYSSGAIAATQPDKEGHTIEFMLSPKRDVSTAKRFFKKMMRAEQRRLPFSISVDKNAAYPEAFSTAQAERIVPKDCKLRRVKYLNNVIEQDHRFVKKKVRASQCFKRFHTAERTLEGIEAVNMVRKGQVKRLAGSEARGQGDVRRFAVRGCCLAKGARRTSALKNNFRNATFLT
jgi:hypothetical protein